MKTIQIRHGVFETNSSSTHSITVVPINQNKLKLVENRVIYPGRLSNKYLEYEGYGYNGYVLSAETKEEKSCLVLNWIRSLLDEDVISKEVYGWLSLMIVGNLDVIDVDWEDCDYPISPFGEDDSFYNYSGSLNKYIAQTEEHIENIINNDSVRVIEHSGSSG